LRKHDVGRQAALIPAELVQPVVIDAQMVGDLVENCPADLFDQLLISQAQLEVRLAKYDDPVGERSPVVRGALGQGYSLIESKDVTLLR
jgi:hypothetical protein